MTIPTIRKTLQRPSRDPNTNRRAALGEAGFHSYLAGMRTTTATITLLACSAPLMGQGLFGAQQVIATNATQESVLEEMMAKVRHRCLDV